MKTKEIIKLIQLNQQIHKFGDCKVTFNHNKKYVASYHHKKKQFSFSIDYFSKLNNKNATKIIYHEIAHALECSIKGQSRHDLYFKAICYHLGGAISAKEIQNAAKRIDKRFPVKRIRS